MKRTIRPRCFLISLVACYLFFSLLQTSILNLLQPLLRPQEFPKQVQSVAKKVRVLDGTNNKITVIPDYIRFMTTCNRLGLSKNRIAEIPPCISALQNLRVLLLDNNRLRSVPPEMFELPKLERLNLAHNHLVELPSNIRNLKSLKYLDVSSNKLVSIPREIGEMVALEEVHTSDNALTRIPVDLAKLERLRIIVAENNMIDSLPSEIMLYCENLQTISLHGNPLTLEKLEETKGYAEFEARRKAKWDKLLAAGVLLGAGRFDEAADRSTASPKDEAGKPTTSAADTSTSKGSPGGSQLTDGATSQEKKKKKKRPHSSKKNKEDASNSVGDTATTATATVN